MKPRLVLRMGLNKEKGAPKPSGDTRVIIARFAVALVLLAVFCIISTAASTGLDASHIVIPIAGLPNELDGLRIAQISDVHSSSFGKYQDEIVSAIGGFKPDIIAITGDFIDGIEPDSVPCIGLVQRLAPMAPVYWVRGNHEYYLDKDSLAQFEAKMAACGAALLDNAAVDLERNGIHYLLAGMDDIARDKEFQKSSLADPDELGMKISRGFIEVIKTGTPEGDYPFKIMLCHRPHWWQLWQEAGYDLALCGHLHGGIIRMPGIGGLLRDQNKFFPEEDAGLYDKQGMIVYISRGLDNLKNLRNIRMNNKPELALIEIQSK